MAVPTFRVRVAPRSDLRGRGRGGGLQRVMLTRDPVEAAPSGPSRHPGPGMPSGLHSVTGVMS